jgi:choline dehydrogenase-like flavoprotein
MRSDPYDYCVVGLGANGGLLIKELANRGYSVIGLEAGPRYDPAVDFVNDEAEMLKLFWNEPRVFDGTGPAKPNCGFGVGGGTLLWCAVAPRMHASDFRTKSLDGVGVDWPIDYSDLAPYYEKIEHDFGVSGNHLENPWDEPRDPYPMPAIEWSWACKHLASGVEKLGAKPLHGPLAINSVSYKGREACNKCGFCITGCMSTAKGCTLTSFIPKAEMHGAVVKSEAFVRRVLYDQSTNRVTGVEYLDNELNTHNVEAKVVILSAHTIETTRLLLISSNPTFPHGLANSSGLVGKNFMVHWDAYVFGRMEEKMNAYKGPILGNLMVQDWYETDGARGFARGFVLESSVPQPFYFGVSAPAIWGHELKEMIDAYDHMAGWWVAGEALPNDNNTISLDPEVRDHRGLPVARMTHEWLKNDKRAIEYGCQKAVDLLEAAGASKTYVGALQAAHAMGTARMGASSKSSVTNSFGQTHDIPNLFICDPSIFPTGASVNTTLTSMALTSRAIDYMCLEAQQGNL